MFTPGRGIASGCRDAERRRIRFRVRSARIAANLAEGEANTRACDRWPGWWPWDRGAFVLASHIWSFARFGTAQCPGRGREGARWRR
ncbi:hypothetical protein GCM10023080_049190 [Streptomyces pseudoechinosporeus]